MEHHTNTETIRLLCKGLLGKLGNQKLVEFDAEKRAIILEDLYGVLRPSVLTEEDLKEKTLSKMGASRDELQDTGLEENVQYRTARAMVRKSFGEDELNGLYYQKNLKTVAEDVIGYLMKSPTIEEVYESDDDLQTTIVAFLKRFNPEHFH